MTTGFDDDLKKINSDGFTLSEGDRVNEGNPLIGENEVDKTRRASSFIALILKNIVIIMHIEVEIICDTWRISRKKGDFVTHKTAFINIIFGMGNIR